MLWSKDLKIRSKVAFVSRVSVVCPQGNMPKFGKNPCFKAGQIKVHYGTFRVWQLNPFGQLVCIRLLQGRFTPQLTAVLDNLSFSVTLHEQPLPIHLASPLLSFLGPWSGNGLLFDFISLPITAINLAVVF